MQNSFEVLINSYIENKVGIAEHFLEPVLAKHLSTNLQQLYNTGSLAAAGTGTTAIEHNLLFRSDLIYWLDRSHNNPHENEFLNLVEHFILHLNATCYTGITGYEFHYTLYEKDAFYKKHLDQFKTNDSRKFSMIFYLNEHWKTGDGGELQVYHEHTVQSIAPENGKGVFFSSSELAHEVLVTHKPRMSITGWLKS